MCASAYPLPNGRGTDGVGCAWIEGAIGESPRVGCVWIEGAHRGMTSGRPHPLALPLYVDEPADRRCEQLGHGFEGHRARGDGLDVAYPLDTHDNWVAIDLEERER